MRRVSLLLLFVSPALSCIGGGMGGNAEFETHHDSAYQLITKLQVADAALHPGQCVELLCARLAGNHFSHTLFSCRSSLCTHCYHLTATLSSSVCFFPLHFSFSFLDRDLLLSGGDDLIILSLIAIQWHPLFRISA